MLPGQIKQVTKFGSLVFNGVNLNSDPRWSSYRNSDLWDDEVFRGENLQLPRRPGRRAKRKIKDEIRYLLPLVVSGTVSSGGAYLGLTNAEGRCLSTLTILKTTLTDPAEKSVPIVYNAPGGAVWTSIAQYLGLRKNAYSNGLWDGELEFILLSPWVVT